MGIQVSDAAGRVNCIIPTPNGDISNLCFGGPKFDTLFRHVRRPRVQAQAAGERGQWV